MHVPWLFYPDFNGLREDERYWQCFWCSKQYGSGEKQLSIGYKLHARQCHARYTLHKFSQQDMCVCEFCNGVKIIYSSTNEDKCETFGCVLCSKHNVIRDDKKHLNKHKMNLPFTLCLRKIPIPRITEQVLYTEKKKSTRMHSFLSTVFCLVTF